MGDFWDDAGSCLYDDDEDDVWECLDEAFQDWLGKKLGCNDKYDELEDEDDSDRGFTLEAYEDDWDDVGDQQSTRRRSETVLEHYQRQWASLTPTSIYQSMNDVDTHGPSFRLTADEYLTVNFTAFLESTSPCSSPSSADWEASPWSPEATCSLPMALSTRYPIGHVCEADQPKIRVELILDSHPQWTDPSRDISLLRNTPILACHTFDTVPYMP